MDVNALNQLLNAQEEEKLEEIRTLVKSIQDTRMNNPEVWTYFACEVIFIS
jgi:hypothetical protein